MSRRLRRALLAAVLLAFSASNLTRAQSQTISLPGYPNVGSPATVTVASPGAEPRTRLRYKVTAGQVFVMSVTTSLGLTMSLEGMSMPAMDMPTMKMTANLTVKDVAANGDITYDIAFTEMTAEALPGMDPSMVAMVQGAAGQITALKGTMTTTDRGVSKSGGLDLNKIPDPNLRQTLGSVSGSLESMSMPLPEEAVGMGAKWEVRQAINAAGAQTFQRVECEVTSISASSVSLRLKVDQTTPPQSISNPQLPAGASMEIEKMGGTGTGTSTIQLGSLVPTSEIQSTNAASMVMSMGGQSQKMAVDTRVKVSIAPKKN
jgi:hypothetical protein